MSHIVARERATKLIVSRFSNGYDVKAKILTRLNSTHYEFYFNSRTPNIPTEKSSATPAQAQHTAANLSQSHCRQKKLQNTQILRDFCK